MPPEAPPLVRGRLLLTLAALSAFGPVSLDLYLPAFPSMAADLGVPVAELQITFSACLIGLGLGQLFYGPLSDRYGRRRPLLAGLTLFTLASIACALAPSLPFLTSMRLLQGLGGCAGLAISRAIVRDLVHGRDLARSFSLIGSVSMLAPLVGPAIGATVLSFTSWRVAFGLLAAFGAACWAASWALPETHPPQARTAGGVLDAMRTYAWLLRQRRFIMPATIMAASAATLLAYVSSSSVVFMDGYGLTAPAFAVLFAVMALFFISGIRLNLRLLLRHSVEHLLRGYLSVQLLALLVTCLVVFLHGSLALVLVSLVAVKVCLGGTFPNAMAQTMHPFPEMAGSASALVGALQFVGSGVVAAILTVLQGTPVVEMVAMMTALTAVSAAMAWLMVRQRQTAV